MNLLREEVKLWLYKWKEPLIMGVITLFGLKLTLDALSNYNIILLAIGSAIVVIGICVFIASYMRISFSKFPNGVGVVEVKEKQIIYFDPSGGLAFSSDSIVSITLNACNRTGLIWRITTEDGSIIKIPLNAMGNEKLYDAFMTLPKIDQAQLISSVKKSGRYPKNIWSK